MVEAGEIINSSANILNDLVIEVGAIGHWLQAIGVLVIIWIIIQIVNQIVNRKNYKKLRGIRQDINRLEKKIDKLNKKK